MLLVTHQQEAGLIRSPKVVLLRVMVLTVGRRILALTHHHLAGSVDHLLLSVVERVTLILLVLLGLVRQV